MRSDQEPDEQFPLLEAIAESEGRVLGPLLKKEWALMEEALCEEAEQLLARFPRHRSRIRWEALSWRMMLEQGRGNRAAELAAVRQRLRMRPHNPWGRALDYLTLGDLLRQQGDVEGAVRALDRGVRYAAEHGDSTAISLLHTLVEMGRLKLRAHYVRAVQQAGPRLLRGPVPVPRTAEELARLVVRLHSALSTPGAGHSR